MIQKVNIQILLLSTLLFSIPAEALVILQQASLPINVDYDTNLNLTQQKEGVWRYTSIPRYSLAAVDERNKWFTDLALTLQRSSNKDISADREDPSVNLGWQHELEKGAFSITAAYDKRSSRFAQFNTNALLDVDGTSVSKSLAANFSHSFTERLRFSLGANYSKTTYTDSSFTNSTSKTISSTITYDWNERNSPFVQLIFTDFKPDRNLAQPSQPSTSKNILVGSTLLIAPRWTFAPSVGVNSTSTSGDNVSAFGNNGSGSGWIANTTLSYLSEKDTFQAVLSRSVAPSGLGSLQKTDNLGLAYSHQFSEVSKGGLDFNIGKSQSDFDSETAQLVGYYSRELSLNWQMRFTAGHRSQKQNTLSANNNNVGISLIYNIPQF